MAATKDSAKVTLSKRGLQRLRSGHLWIFRSDIEDHDLPEPGSICRLLDRGGNFCGHAFYGASELAVRVLNREDEFPDMAFFKRRMSEALARRRRWAPTRDALRLIHGEADLLPGLLVDRFGDALVVQSLSLAVDQREQKFIELLIELTGAKSVVVRDDGMTREYEGLEDRKALVHGTSALTRYHEGDLAFEIDLLADQKTGAFLDQYDNHLLAAKYARGEALDICCYHGGFGLQMAASAKRVRCVDQSELAISRVKDNAKRNGIDNVEGVCGNAFDVLRQYEEAGERFDTIVIDPPAFAKRKSALDGAYRGYKELNLRALRMLNPGGVLISCSCSAKVTRELFEVMLEDAARDAKRHVIVHERKGAGPDHPVMLGMPETEYLKCFVLETLPD